MNLSLYPQIISAWLLSNGFKVLIILVITLIAKKSFKAIIKRIFTTFDKRNSEAEAQKRSTTLHSVLNHLMTMVVYTIAGLMVLMAIGINIGPILAAAGILGLAVGFGAQSLVKDVISGFFMLLEDQIRVGDVVTVAGRSGLVEKINLRLTIIRDASGAVHYVPNGSIDLVTNMTKEYSRFVFDIGVGYNEDVDQVMEVMRQVDEDLRSDTEFGEDILNPIEIFGLDKFGDSALIVKGRTTTKPGKQWGIGREFNRRLKKRFDELNIEIPFPHITLYMGEDKSGQAPPMRVSLSKPKENQ